MVANITSLTGNGLKDWLVQRSSAIYLLIYSCFLVGFLLTSPHLDFAQWHALFANKLFCLATIISLVSISLHSWVGIWTVTTDYIKCTVIRLSVQMLVALWLIGQFIWGLMIVWGQ